MIKGTKIDESIWIRVPEERGEKYFFLRNMYVSPESKSTSKEVRRKFGEVAVDVHKYERQG